MSLQPPFAIVPLLLVTTRRKVLGRRAFGAMTIALGSAAALVATLNVWMRRRLAFDSSFRQTRSPGRARPLLAEQECLSMSPKLQLVAGKVMLSLIALLTIVAPFLADWNATHIYNPTWPPHAKFHNAQTMSMAVLLGAAALFFLWRGRNRRADLLAATMFTSFYWVSQVIAFVFPGVAWTDPDLLKPGQSLSDFGIQLKGDAVLLPVIALCAWLVLRGSSQDPDL